MKTKTKGWIVVNLQNSSTIRVGGDRQHAIDYAMAEYGHVVEVNDTQKVVYVSQVPSL